MPSVILSDNGVSSGSAGIKTTADSTGALALQTTTAAGAATTALTIDTSQNVGIGTASPAGNLQISGSGDRSLMVTGGTSGTVSVQLGDSAAAGQGGMSYDNAVDALFFKSNGSERMRIDSSGNLLFNSGYGSVATAYGCRAWVNFNGTTAATNASGNITSVTRTTNGTFTVAFTTSMPDTNYVVVGTASSTQYLRAVQTGSSATGSVVVRTVAENATVVDTSGNVHIAIFR